MADEAPGYAVEDFNYPQADKIRAEDIVLKRGDGHIMLAGCAGGTGQLKVPARVIGISPVRASKRCFQAVGDSGWLTMEIPQVIAIRGNDYVTEVDMTVGTEKKLFDIEKCTIGECHWTPVEEPTDGLQRRPHTLVKISTARTAK